MSALAPLLATGRAAGVRFVAAAVIGDAVVAYTDGYPDAGVRRRMLAAVGGRRLYIGDATEAETLRALVARTFAGRSERARALGDLAAAERLTVAANAIAGHQLRVLPDGRIDDYELLLFAFDQAVLARTLLAEKLLDWVDNQIQSPPPYIDSQGGVYTRAPRGRPIKVGTPSELDADYGTLPIGWYARHVAYGLLLSGNTDHKDPGTSAALLELAARLVAEWTTPATPAPKTRILNFYGFVTSQLPASAAWSRAWIGTQTTIANWHKPTTSEVLSDGVTRAVDAAKRATEPPGGYGFGALVIVAVVAGIATWRKT